MNLKEAYNNACSINISKAESFDNYKDLIEHRKNLLDRYEMKQSFEQLLDISKALSNELRLRLLIYIYLSKSTCFCELVPIFEIEHSTLTYHIRFLLRAKLITERKEGKWKIFSPSNKLQELLPSNLQSLLLESNLN